MFSIDQWCRAVAGRSDNTKKKTGFTPGLLIHFYRFYQHQREAESSQYYRVCATCRSSSLPYQAYPLI